MPDGLYQREILSWSKAQADLPLICPINQDELLNQDVLQHQFGVADGS